MHGESQNGYGLWFLVIVNSFIFIFFAFSFVKPKTKTDWRSLGAFSAFILAMFTEMYGIPLTIYFLSGWLGKTFPGLDFFSHNNGHLWITLFGSEIDPHFHPIHLAANAMIIGGFVLLALAWKVLHAAQSRMELATTGLYSKIRHPQYMGFVAIMLGFLLMWPTILTLIMFPALVFMYHRLARKEEDTMIEEFGSKYMAYKNSVPAYFPKWASVFKRAEEGS